MTSLINALQTEDSRTLNGMVTSSSTTNPLVDLFFVAGAIRSSIGGENGKNRLIRLYESARKENPLLTRKLIFWMRDVRGGAGEREAFRTILKYAAKDHPEEIRPNLELIPEYGRWDDVFCLIGTSLQNDAIELIVDGLNRGDGLLAKWMPRLGGKVNPSKRFIANLVRSRMGLSYKDYRKMLVSLTNVVESKMCARKFSDIDYEKVPSLAISRYSNAFMNRDSQRFSEYKQSLSKGESKINVGAVYPYDIIKNVRYGDSGLANEQWNSLPNYMEGSTERILPVCDTSGSMGCRIGSSVTALDVCISLGLYIAERNEGPFKDHFITFSTRPELQKIVGSNLKARCANLQSANWNMSTNLEATFELILNQAVKHSIKESEMPTMILILSDMEFNQACDPNHNAIKMIRSKYESHGYVMPKIVFWNLNSKSDNFPVKSDDKGTFMVSGFSPEIMKTVLSGKSTNPIELILETIQSDRYEAIR